MDFLASCHSFVFAIKTYLAIPSIILFLGTAIILTLKTGFIQIRAFPKFLNLLFKGVKEHKDAHVKTISPFQALFTAMATTIGMGNIVGPSMAISIGGPGALFWLILYIFFGSVTKFIEVTFSVESRTTSEKGDIIGGPSQYLKKVTPLLGNWYALLTIFLFTGWSSIQVNTVSCIWAQEGVPNWITGVIIVAILLAVVLGGVTRIGSVASKLVPIKFVLYITFVLLILFKDLGALRQALLLVFKCAFNPEAACGAIAGVTLLQAMREGIYKSIFITEAGVGTSSIAHALSDVKNPIDQGILAMFSGLADMLLCTLSGLLTLVTSVWTSGKLSNTLIYEAFKMHSPVAGGEYVLLISVFLFVMTALIGNTFNGSQSFASFTKYRYMNLYFVVAALIAFSGSLIAMPFLWDFMDIILFLVAAPNLIGLLILAYKYPKTIEYK